jgi:D-aminoacyl-tRNA deacylase
MRAVVQRVAHASVTVEGRMVGEIHRGLCVLVGAVAGDVEADAQFIARKLSTLRVFPDADDRMNLDVRQAGGSVLLISQFTLAADTTSGTRPSFSRALAPEQAVELLALVKMELNRAGLEVAEGAFGAKMLVELANDGPVTLILDSQDKRRK